jgi:hypothetical protein
MSNRTTAIAVCGLLAVPAAASAITAVSPINNAATGIHPVLTWTLAPGEAMGTVAIADNPTTTPDGEFFSEHQVDFGAPAETATRYAPTSPLFAGAYWWSAKAYDVDFNAHRTPPAAFHIDAVLTAGKWGWTRYSSIRTLAFEARWKTNVHVSKITIRISRNGRTLWARSRSVETFTPMSESREFINWENRRVKRRSKIRVTITINLGGGKVSRSSRVTKAP